MYCNKDDLIARGWYDELVSLTDKAGVLGGVIDDVALNQAIADATAEIDSYLVGHIALPLTNPSDFLIRKACDMVRFYLYDIGAIEPVVERYEAALDFLKSVAENPTALSALVTVSVSKTVLHQPVCISPAAVFSDALLGKM